MLVSPLRVNQLMFQLRIDVYLESATRREMWNLAHAHGGMLGILCLVFGPVADRWLPAKGLPKTSGLLRWSAILMPLGFFVGGIGNTEGDPSLGIVLVPLGGVLLLVSLLRAAVATLRNRG